MDPRSTGRHFALALLLVGLTLAAVACGENEPEPLVYDSAKVDEIRAGWERSRAVPLVPVELTPSPLDDLLVDPGLWTTDFDRGAAPLDEFLPGGPSKDGIPALDTPAFESVEEAHAWLDPEEPVVELVLDGEARAYPLQVLIWHEIANDVLAGAPVVVTFCPLCNTALVFDRRVDARVLDFGTTGFLRNADLVMYDRQTESWWQQFGGEALVGELTGQELTPLLSAIVSWSDFARRHPDGDVLSRETGFERPYGANPYVGYDDVASPPFRGIAASDERLAPKERVVFVERNGEALAVPFGVLAGRGLLELELGGEAIEVEWRAGTRSALDAEEIASSRDVGSVEVRLASTGERLVADTPFWFAVAAFRPDVRIVR